MDYINVKVKDEDNKVPGEDGYKGQKVVVVDGEGNPLGNIKLGAVELKDATTETRAVIGEDGLVVTLGTALDSDTDSITTVPQPASSLGHGVTNVTTAGTDVALAASTACKYVIIQARYENTSVIAVGGSGVDATATTGTGIILESGDSITLDVDNLADVYIDSRVNGEGVRYTYGVA